MTKRTGRSVISLRGVRHNNLKGFDLDLPIGKLIVVTGVSGSGKSSLAFDTLYAEGQRRYIETFSPYARQFFDRMDKPQVDRIDNIPPAIAIEQRNAVRTTRSTVGTMTELCDYLKVLWPRLARLHCRGCGQPVRREPPQLIWQTLSESWTRMGSPGEPAGTPPEVLITFDLALSEKLSLGEMLRLIERQGYQRLWVDGEIVRVNEALAHPALARRPNRLSVVQDRLRLEPSQRARFVEACEQAYHFGRGRLTVLRLGDRSATARQGKLSVEDSRPFSAALHCAHCDLDYREPTPALFSFNHPLGACPTCRGFGRIITIDYNLAIPDRSLSLRDGAVRPWRSGFSRECQDDLLKFCKARGVPVDVPFGELPEEMQRWVIEGDPDYGIDDSHQWPYAWYGIKGYFRWLESKAYKMHVRVLLSRYRAYTRCPDCHGQRLQPEALLYRARLADWLPADRLAQFSEPADTTRRRTQARDAADLSIDPWQWLSLADFYALPLDRALGWIEALVQAQPFPRTDPLRVVLEEVHARLGYLVEVGLGYLTLDRPTRTLSGGETERVNLTACLGTRLVNTLFVLDEPSVGLHPRDTARLVRVLERLRDTGNTVVVVEHEESVIRAADEVVDLGPGSGEAGGQIVFHGPLPRLLRCRRSLTGRYLQGTEQIELPARRPVLADGSCDTLGAHARIESLPVDTEPEGEARAAVLHEAAVPYRLEGITDADADHNGFVVPVLRVAHAYRHNLKDLTVEIPLRRFVCLTGVSGSGKTTLAREVLYPALQRMLHPTEPELIKASDRLDAEPEEVEQDEENGPELEGPAATRVTGHEHLERVVLVDQSPLSKTPRSNPAVYIGAFDFLRQLFAQSERAQQLGLGAGAFSFNSTEGQCDHCRGSGFEKIEMQFLSDVFIRCPQCNGRRYREHVLEVKLMSPDPDHPSSDRRKAPRPREWSIADLLEATVDEAIAFLDGLPHQTAVVRARERLDWLRQVGLGYLRLGQPLNTLSGGESQRLKLVSHLAATTTASARPDGDRAAREHIPEWAVRRGLVAPKPRGTLFILDEPTTGLHFHDVRLLLGVLQRLVDAGHSLLVIEHNLDVIKCADWIIDLGPEAGEGGGRLVVAGPPERVAACKASHTGRFLRPLLQSKRTRVGRTRNPQAQPACRS